MAIVDKDKKTIRTMKISGEVDVDESQLGIGEEQRPD